MTAKISMLLPARGRPAHLERAVASVFELAAKPDDVEVLVRLDDDDPSRDTEVAVLAKFKNVDVWTGERLGYHRMHDYYTGLCKLAIGRGEPDWLFVYNDDIEMATKGWDQLLRECPPFAVQFVKRDISVHNDYTLPVLGTSLFKALGHVSLNGYCDAWISDVSGFAGTSVTRDDIVFHHHRLTDETMAGQAKNGPAEWARFTTEEQKAMRRADMETLMRAPEWVTRYDDWIVEQIDHVGVDYINLAAGERKAGAVRLRGRK